MKRMLSPVRLTSLAGAILVVMGSVGPAIADEAVSDGVTYRAKARADAITVEVYDPSMPAVPPSQPILFGSPASTQALIDSLGTSTAFAGAPYPGDFAVSLFPLLNGFVFAPNGLPPVPPYPFYVDSSFPLEPKDEFSQPGSELRSESNKDASQASANFGGDHGSASMLVSSGSSSVARDPATGTVVAQAESAIKSLVLEPGIRIADVESTLKMAVAPGASPVVEHRFSVGVISVGDLTVGATGDDVVLAPGQEPVSVPDLSMVSAALEPLGVSVEYLPAEETPTSIESAGLAFTWERDVPTRGLVEVTAVIGRVSVAADSGTAQTASGITPLPVDQDFGDAGSSFEPAPGDIAAENSATLDLGAGSASSPAEDAASSGAANVPSNVPIPAVSAPLSIGKGSSALYRSILLAGALLLCGPLLFGRLGFRASAET